MSGNEHSQAMAQCRSTRETIARQLVGVWSLVNYTDEQEGREDSYPFGPAPEGFLIYTSGGFVSAQLMKPGRSLFQSRDWRGGTPEEYQQAGSGYIAYCGLYEVDEEKETVTHIPSVALLPNLILTGQLRSIALNGDRLTLSTAGIPAANGAAVTSRLEWQRTSVKGMDMTREEVARAQREDLVWSPQGNDVEKLSQIYSDDYQRTTHSMSFGSITLVQ